MHTKDGIHTEGTLQVDGAATLTGAVTTGGALTAGGAVTSGGDVDTANTTASAVKKNGANGQSVEIGEVSEELTIAAAATTASTIEIPIDSVCLGIACRVTVVIPTATDWDIGITGDTARFGATIAVAADTTHINPGDVLFDPYTSATTLLITPQASPGAATGKVRISIFYMKLTAPTS